MNTLCPKCGFGYSWDGVTCGHCHYSSAVAEGNVPPPAAPYYSPAGMYDPAGSPPPPMAGHYSSPSLGAPYGGVQVQKPASAGETFLGVGIVMVVLGGIAAGISYWLAGSTAWNVISIILGVLPALAVLGAVSDMFKRGLPRGGDFLAGFLMLLAYLAVYGVWLGVGFIFGRATIYVDNYSSTSVQILMNDKEWLGIAAGEKKEVSLQQGRYTVVLRDQNGGQELDRFDVTAGSGSKYILNVLKAHTYYRGTAEYSVVALPFGGEAPPVPVNDAWIEANVDYLFEEPPGSVTIEGQSTSKTYILREPGLVPPQGVPDPMPGPFPGKEFEPPP